MNFTDAVTISGTRRTADGYLVAEARSVRTGVQLYAGKEVGKPEMDVVRVYRPAESVFAADSLQSFTHAPVTLDHPSEAVTADNWKQLAVGEVSTAAKVDGEWVHLPLILKDKAAIAAVESGKRELSAGYCCELVWGDGTTEDGQTFDAIQTGIKINHLAIVDRARAGSQARIGDGAASWGISPVSTTADERKPDMPDNLRTVMVDGLSVSTTDQGAQAIEKLTNDKAALSTKLADADKAHQTAIAAKDADLAKKDAEIDALKAKVVDGAALDKLVQDRADLIAIATSIAKDVKTAGLSDADIRKAVVVAKLGDAAVKDKADAYIDARFDILAEDAKKSTDTFKRAVADGSRVPEDIKQVAAKAREDYLNSLRDGWKTDAAKH